MDIKIDTEAVCQQIQDAVPDLYPVFYCRIEPASSGHTVEILIPENDAEFGVQVYPDKTFAVMRVNPDQPSRTMLDWAIGYLKERGFVLKDHFK